MLKSNLKIAQRAVRDCIRLYGHKLKLFILKQIVHKNGKRKHTPLALYIRTVLDSTTSIKVNMRTDIYFHIFWNIDLNILNHGLYTILLYI